MKTLTIINKNFKRLLNSKAATLIILLGPIILIGIIGLALHDTSIKNIEAGIYAEGANQEFLDGIQEKLAIRSIQSTNYYDLPRCEEDVKNEVIQFCLEIKPPEEGELGEITQDLILHVDYSKQRTVWNLIGKVQGIVDDETVRYQEESINSMNEGLEEVKENSEIANQKIDFVLSNLQNLKTYLDSEEENLDSINEEVSNSKDQMGDLDTQLKEIQEGLDDSGIPGSQEYVSQIEDMRENLKKTETSLGDLESSTTSGDISLQTKNIESAITELENTQNQLNEMTVTMDKINQKNLDNLINPIKLSHASVMNSQEGVVEKNLEFLDYLFPSFLIFFILFDSIIFSSSARIKERKSNSYVRNIVSKAKSRQFIFGDFITGVILISIQITAIIFLSSFFLNLAIIENINSIILLTVLAVSIFSLIGIAIGSIFNNQESSMITSISTSLLLFMFSSLVTPIETLPKAIAVIIKNTPLTLIESKLRLTTIFNIPLVFSTQEIFALSATALGLIILIAFFYKKNKTKEI